MKSLGLVFRFFAQYFRPRSKLVEELQRSLRVPEFCLVPEFSGRTALRGILEAIETQNQRVILVPDYICNVVHLSVEAAGFRWISYPTAGDTYSLIELKCIIERSRPAALLTASVFGSGALLSALKDDDFRGYLKSRGIFVIVDLCQDIRLLREIPVGYGSSLAAFVSFNDKSFFGAMGGAAVLPAGFMVDAPPFLSVRQTIALYRFFALKLYAACKKRQSKPRGFSFSKCASFPYRLDRYRAAHLQLALAVVGVRLLRELTDRKQSFVQKARNEGANALFLDTASYIVMPSGNTLGRRLKSSYASPDDARSSLRPYDVIVHNKGFLDEL